VILTSDLIFVRDAMYDAVVAIREAEALTNMYDLSEVTIQLEEAILALDGELPE
jgi:hypothetical protein